jgi:hypothetical protein
MTSEAMIKASLFFPYRWFAWNSHLGIAQPRNVLLNAHNNGYAELLVLSPGRTKINGKIKTFGVDDGSLQRSLPAPNSPNRIPKKDRTISLWRMGSHVGTPS